MLLTALLMDLSLKKEHVVGARSGDFQALQLRRSQLPRLSVSKSRKRPLVLPGRPEPDYLVPVGRAEKWRS
jgi:hypothetical protein